MKSRSFALLVLLLTGAWTSGQVLAQHETDVRSSAAPVYSVAEYDPARDPAEDLQATIKQAQAENKRILLEVGGDWCSWCHALDAYVHENAAVAEALRNGFLIMKVNMSEENENQAFLSRYPEIPGYPHLFVLERDGTLLHSQGTGELEEGPSYNERAVLGFLSAWAPDERGTKPQGR